MNKTERLFATLLLLQARQPIRAADIGAHFEVSKRTVYRDIGALCESGVPIISERGEGYSIMRGYFLPPLLFTPREATILWIGTEFVKEQTDSSYKADAESAFLKIESILPAAVKSNIRELKQRISLGYYESPQGANETTFLEAIRAATLESRLIRIAYLKPSADEAGEREVEPLGLIFGSRFWYLIGHCRLRQDVRTFRIDRIRDLKILDETFEPRNDFSIQDYLARDRSGERRRHGGVAVRISFISEAAAKAKGQIPWRIVGEERRSHDRVVLTLRVDDFRWIVGWILSYGNEAKVLEPRDLRDRVIEFLESLKLHHGANRKP